jgi:hypothetical protein
MFVTTLHTNKKNTTICINTHINKTVVEFGYVGNQS